MKINLLTLLSFSAVITFAVASCGSDDENPPATTSGTTSGTTNTGTTSGTTTTGTTSGTTTGSGTLALSTSGSSNVTVTCSDDPGGLTVQANAANGNTCTISLGSVPAATKTFTLTDGENGTWGPDEALIIVTANSGTNSYGSTNNGGQVTVTVNGSNKQVSFSDIALEPSGTATTGITATGSFNCQ